jgi:hypothetical protein
MASPGSHTSSSRPPTYTSSEPNLLRFPKLDFDERIDTWLSQSSPPAMPSYSETHSDDISSLGDSAYEFIDTDEESRDDNATESVASTDFGRPDDVASLADTERSDEDDNSSHESPPAAEIPRFDGLDGPEHTPTIGQSVTVYQDDIDRTLGQSIEFEEPDRFGDEISVKHTVADFSEEETARIAETVKLLNPPQRLVATICQTMTRQGLSTKEPLRILYVGCHTAKQDIIRKIASSVAASVGNDRNTGSSTHRTSQLFHVVPITAFGSEKPPEIELMESSGYQIKVEDCIGGHRSASVVSNDILKLDLGDNYSYHSISTRSGYEVVPAWELPHVAIFYCSGNDTKNMVQTRNVARMFMSRHRVPSIVISHKQSFDKPVERMTLDQHAIHMCLESRNPTFVHLRLPIDLDSFKTIDARQMNRNLAYLTGLHEPQSVSFLAIIADKEATHALTSDIEKTSYSLSDSVNFIRTRTGAEWRALLPVGLLFISVILALVTAAMKSQVGGPHGVLINGNLTFTEPMSIDSATPTASTPIVAPSLTTSTEIRTSTKTITVVQKQSSVSNSLALKPSTDLGQVGDKKKSVTAIKIDSPTVCTAEVLGDREILIRMPSTAKLSWLSKEALSFNVTRQRGTVETERVYSTGEGIVLQLAQEEAYGVLNISIVTTRKPKINETFKVDFGTRKDMDFFWTRLQQQFQSPDSMINSTMTRVQTFAAKVMAQSRSISETTREQVEEANKLTSKRVVEAGERITKVAKTFSLDVTRWSAILSKELDMQISEARKRLDKVRYEVQSLQDHHVREPLDSALVRAQVQSKLYWLKMQGKHAEYHEYEIRAAKASKQRFERRKAHSRNRVMAPKGAGKSCIKRRRGCRAD